MRQILSNTLRLNFCYLKIIHILHQRYHPEVIGHILKSKQNNKCVCIHEITRLTIMKMTMKMNNRSHRCNVNRLMWRHEHKYSKYKMCLSKMMLVCIKKRLSNSWSSIPEKVKQHWGCAEKKRVVVLPMENSWKPLLLVTHRNQVFLYFHF